MLSLDPVIFDRNCIFVSQVCKYVRDNVASNNNMGLLRIGNFPAYWPINT